MKLINYTPHALNIQAEDGSFYNLPKGDFIIRVATGEKQIIGNINGINIYSSPVVSKINREDLPGMEDWDDTFGVVSMVALEAIKRDHAGISYRFLSPGELIRNAEGQPIGCKGLNS